MRIENARKEAAEILARENIPRAGFEADLLLSHITGLSRLEVITHPEINISQKDAENLFSYAKRRARGEPAAYILGEKEFMGNLFLVDNRVLIPRPDTETLCESAISEAKNRQCAALADICTGSGAVGISAARAVKGLKLTLSDISEDALSVAKTNAQRLLDTMPNIIKSDLFDSFDSALFDIITANPPYISHSEYMSLESTVKDFEPKLALVAMDDGLRLIKKIIAQAKAHLKLGGLLLIEIGYDQSERVIKLFENAGYENVFYRRDLAGIIRVIGGYHKCE